MRPVHAIGERGTDQLGQYDTLGGEPPQHLADPFLGALAENPRQLAGRERAFRRSQRCQDRPVERRRVTTASGFENCTVDLLLVSGSGPHPT